MVLTKWNRAMTSKFIALYREEECLWRIDSRAYRDRDARDAALRNIVVGMNLENFTEDDVKKKIKHLRATYMAEYNKKEKALQSGTSRTYKPSLRWFNEMDAFIKYVNDKRKLRNSSIGQPNTNMKLEDLRKRNADMQADATDEMTKYIDTNPQSPTVYNRSYLTKQVNAENLNRVEQTNELEETNECAMYGKYVGIQLKTMDEEDAILAQQEIQSILTRYKLKKLRRNTSHSQHSDYQSLASPTDGDDSHSYDNNFSEVEYIEVDDIKSINENRIDIDKYSVDNET